MEDENQLVKQLYEKVAQLREDGVNPYPASDGTEYNPIAQLRVHEDKEKEDLEQMGMKCCVAGRIKGGMRKFGSLMFFHVHDRTGGIQVAVGKKVIGEENFKFIDKMVDVGDIIGVKGSLTKTNKGELSIFAESVDLLTKNVRPLPEKFHGLTDVEARYRQRYLDLMINPEVAETFRVRSQIMRKTREFFVGRGYLEVETPMMQPIAGGATARPFQTYHNALDMDLFLRVAPELYLKRLIVGGFERVFEINRNFRNEGISIQHNPEFTMLEFYQAYATYEDLMDLTEELFETLAIEVHGSAEVEYQGQKVSLARPWKRVKLVDAVLENTDIKPENTKNLDVLRAFCDERDLPYMKNDGWGKLLTIIFDKVVEDKLIQPTFIYKYPTEVSPLSRRNEKDPDFVDRFELFITGREMANAFNELNDPEDQRQRFLMQVEAKKAGDEEAHDYDQDYIRALEYGLPPTAGEGIGIDRLVMLLTDSASIRDVILFPQLRKEQ